MGNEPLISVVIPVYMVEDYLERCVDSVIHQTYKNIEIILVDDGSKDKSGLICDKLSKKDDRIIVCHKENGGLSSARNCGIELSKGEYITLLDSDDYVSNDFIEYLYNLCVDNNAQISCCNFIRTSISNCEFDEISHCDEIVFSNYDACKALLTDYYLPLVIACAKLYSSIILKNNPFPLGKLHEDEAMTCRFLYAANTVVLSSRRLYAYYINENGIMGTQKKYGPVDVEWSMNERINYFHSIGENNLEKLSRDFYVGYLINYSLSNNMQSDDLINDIVKESICVNGLSPKGWLKVLMYKTFPMVYRLRNNLRTNLED